MTMHDTLAVVLVLAGTVTMCRSEVAHAAAADPLHGVKYIVFVGDSLTDGAAWPDWVVATLKANGHPDLGFANAGVCGDTIARVKARLKADVLEQKPDLVTLCIGVNDTITGVPREQYLKDMGDVIGQMRAQGIKVLLMMPPSLEKPEWNAELTARDKPLKELAAQQGCIVGDLHQAFEDAAKEKRRLWGDDGIHHNLDGWQTFGRCVLGALGCTAPMVEKCVPYPGAVTNWLIGPPIPWTAKDPVPAPDLTPGFDAGKVGWKPFNLAAEMKGTPWWNVCMLERGGILPFGEPARVANSGAFALALVKAPAAGPARLLVGGVPNLVVWVNGKEVWHSKVAHGYHPNADWIPIRLTKGENRMVVFATGLFHVSILE